MNILIIDERNGNYGLNQNMEIRKADLVIVINSDGYASIHKDREGIPSEYKVQFIVAQTEAEYSMAIAEAHKDKRIGQPKCEHDYDATMAKVKANWQ